MSPVWLLLMGTPERHTEAAEGRRSPRAGGRRRSEVAAGTEAS